MVKIARETDESTSDAVGHGMMSYPKTSLPDFVKHEMKLV